MIRRIIDFALYYKYELILTICLFANLYPALPDYLYYASMAGMGIAMYRCKARRTGRTGLALALVFFMLLSSLLAGTLDAKAISLAALLYIALANSSEDFYRFKYTFMYISLLAYAFTSVINFYAKHAGINFYEGILISTWGSSTGEFSGYTCHPMWLSSACGIGTIFFVYAMIVMYKRGNKKMTYLLGAASLASIWTTMQGGSRPASGISVLCCLFLILNAFESAMTSLHESKVAFHSRMRVDSPRDPYYGVPDLLNLSLRLSLEWALALSRYSPSDLSKVPRQDLDG